MKVLIKCSNKLMGDTNEQLEDLRYNLHKEDIYSVIEKIKLKPIDDDVTPKDLAGILVTFHELTNGELIETLAIIRQYEAYESEVIPMELGIETEFILDIINRIASLIKTINESCRETIILMDAVRYCINKYFYLD